MRNSAAKAKIEYGDFQTPLALAERICRKLVALGVTPATVVEPTCGRGAFVKAAVKSFASAQQIIGCEINAAYLSELRQDAQAAQVQLQQEDFFAVDWRAKLAAMPDPLLLLGNLPWVTNAVQSTLNSENVPVKKNLHGLNGLDALMGKSNFDISEWMLIRLIEALQGRAGDLAFICKTAIARKLLDWLRKTRRQVAYAGIFQIDAALHFDVAVDSCLLFLRMGGNQMLQACEVFADLDADAGMNTGWRHELLVKDLHSFDQHHDLFGKGLYQWRSGIKHDCAEVMELRRVNGSFLNGLGETVEIEKDYLFPLLKGSDVANGRIHETDRWLIVTQQAIGEDTRGLKHFAPKTWAYLEAHTEMFTRRKSRIYHDAAPYSIFGVGSYSFAPWKMAICGLYKKLDFQRIGKLEGKPVVFDDTVYFLGFDNEAECQAAQAFLQAKSTQQFLDSMIFWDEKRPVKSAILNHLKIPHAELQANTLFSL